MAQVIDASVAVAWCVPSQASTMTDAAFDAVTAFGGHVPSVFWFELLHSLGELQRRKIIHAARVEAFVEDALQLILTIDAAYSTSQMIDLRKLASNHGLGIFDAAYLDLALRSGLPLATRDTRLTRAAETAGAALFKP